MSCNADYPSSRLPGTLLVRSALETPEGRALPVTPQGHLMSTRRHRDVDLGHLVTLVPAPFSMVRSLSPLSLIYLKAHHQVQPFLSRGTVHSEALEVPAPSCQGCLCYL